MSAPLYTGDDFYDDIGGEDKHLDASYESRFEFLDDFIDESHYSECPYCEHFSCVCESDLIE